MGGVIPKFRRQNVASKLAYFQENWALKNGYTSIRIKTRKKYEAMIKFSLNRGFAIKNEIQMDNPMESRIILEKQLN